MRSKRDSLSALFAETVEHCLAAARPAKPEDAQLLSILYIPKVLR
jgi:hypothetical protein